VKFINLENTIFILTDGIRSRKYVLKIGNAIVPPRIELIIKDSPIALKLYGIDQEAAWVSYIYCLSQTKQPTQITNYQIKIPGLELCFIGRMPSSIPMFDPHKINLLRSPLTTAIEQWMGLFGFNFSPMFRSQILCNRNSHRRFF